MRGNERWMEAVERKKNKIKVRSEESVNDKGTSIKRTEKISVREGRRIWRGNERTR